MINYNLDYSNTIIYKIYCKDKDILDVYIGHTTNFKNRKQQHKYCCNNEKLYNCKIYNIIRNNGGWDNWEMIEIANYNCKDLTEARIKEQIHYEELKASLNTLQPYKHNREYYCLICKLQCDNKNDYEHHILSPIHYTNQNKKIFFKYYCNFCDYRTCKKSSYDNHNLSEKHKKMTDKIILETDLHQIMPEKYLSKYSCKKCEKNFKNRSGLWKHNKICKPEITDENKHEKNYEPTDRELLMMLIKDNSEINKMMMEIIKFNYLKT